MIWGETLGEMINALVVDREVDDTQVELAMRYLGNDPTEFVVMKRHDYSRFQSQADHDRSWVAI